MLGLGGNWATISLVAASACGGVTGASDYEGDGNGYESPGGDASTAGADQGGTATGGSATGGSATGGTKSGGVPSTGGATPLPEAGSTSDAGSAGAPPDTLACDEQTDDFDWDGPFKLKFSDPRLERRSWPDDLDCTVQGAEVEELDAEGSITIDLTCAALVETDTDPEPITFELSIAFGPLPSFHPRVLDAGSTVQLQYGYEQAWQQPIRRFLLVATDATPGFDAGDLILGAFVGDFWKERGLGPVAIALGPELCRDPDFSDDCIHVASHSLDVEFQGDTVNARLGTTVLLDSDPPLAFRVVADQVVTTTEPGCCWDCEEDVISYALWTPGE
jgi:hypothetical protein